MKNYQYIFSSYDPMLDIEKLSEKGINTILEELEKTRKFYEALDSIIEDSMDGIFVTDGEANVIKVNKAYEEMSGVKKEEILGKNMRELENWTITRSASLEVLHTGRMVTIEQQYLRTKRYAYITSTPIFDEDENITMIVSNNRDFKRIDQLEEKLAAAQQLVNRYKVSINKTRRLTKCQNQNLRLLKRDYGMFPETKL